MFKFSMKPLSLMACILAGVLFITGCKGCKDPVDEALNATLDFSGIYENTDGYEIELELDNETGSADFTKVPAQSGLSVRAVGDPCLMSMVLQDDGSWRGSARTKDMSLMTLSDVRFSSGTMTITPIDGSAPHTFTKTAGSGTGGTGTGGTGTGGTGTGTGTDTVYKKKHTGKEHQEVTITYSPPAGTKTMTIRTKEFSVYERNSADMFVRKGQKAKITHTYPPANSSYFWEADHAGTKPNREEEVYTVSNPSGTYYITLYGYNEDFESWLIITIGK